MANIVFCVSSMHTGGAERVAALLCNRWAELGHNVSLIATYRYGETCNYQLNENVELIYLAKEVELRSKWMPNFLCRVFALRRLIARTRPQAIYSFLTLVNVMTLLATAFMRAPVIVSERSYPPKMPLERSLNIARWFLYPFASKVVLQTQEGFRWLKSAIPLSSGTFIANPVLIPIPRTSPECDPRALIPKGLSVVLAIGRLGPEKQFDILMKAFARTQASHPNAVLAILGEGPERPILEILAKDLGIEKTVFLVGRVGNIQDWYDAADLFVLSSEFEGFPNALLEAAASGVTAISFDCLTGPREILADADRSSLVAPEAGADGLAEAMIMALHRRVSKIDAVTLQAKYSVEKIAGQWLQLAGIE